MKKAKIIFALILALILLLSVGISAFAEDAVYDATKKYVEAMAELDGATCTPSGKTTIGQTTYEIVKVDYEGELSDYKSHFNVLFNEAGDEILMSMPVLNFASDKLNDVLADVNRLNAATTSVKLYVDTQKSVIMAELFLLVTEDSLLDISLSGTGMFIGFTDQIFEGMKDYAA